MFITGLLNAISEIGFLKWCSQLVLKKALLNKKATCQGGSDFSIL